MYLSYSVHKYQTMRSLKDLKRFLWAHVSVGLVRFFHFHNCVFFWQLKVLWIGCNFSGFFCCCSFCISSIFSQSSIKVSPSSCMCHPQSPAACHTGGQTSCCTLKANLLHTHTQTHKHTCIYCIYSVQAELCLILEYSLLLGLTWQWGMGDGCTLEVDAGSPFTLPHLVLPLLFSRSILNSLSLPVSQLASHLSPTQASGVSNPLSCI